MDLLASRRWWNSIPFIMALADLLFLIWSASLAFAYPHDGILSFSQSGLIRELDTLGYEINNLREGDVILLVEGVPFNEAMPLYVGKRAGETINFVVNRNGEELFLTIRLFIAPIGVILTVVAPFLVALTFWGIGVGILAFKPADATSNLFFLFTQTSSVLLSAGLSSSVGPSWTSHLFNFLLWFIGPVAVHFHLYFPQPTHLRWKGLLLGLLYFTVAVGGAPYLLWGTRAIRSSARAPEFIAAGQLFLAFCLLVVLYLLVYAYRHSASPGVRGKIRIVLLGGALGLLPVITLTILPDTLLRQPIIPYSFAFLFLGILPLTYGYAIIRHRLIEIERHVNRGATFILVFSILGGFYLFLYAFLHRLLPANVFTEPLINTLLVLVLATVFAPLRQRIQRIVDTAFYGGWYDYRSAVTQITQGWEQITQLSELASTVSERLVKTLQLEDACVFVRDLEGAFSVIGVAPREQRNEAGNNGKAGMSFSALPKNSLTYLLNIGVVERTSLRRSLAEAVLSPEEHRLLDSEQVYLWVPVIGHGQVLALLALGPKLGGDIFSGEDMDILRVVARQLGPLIENIHLVTQLRQYAAELEQRVEERTAELYAAKERVEAVLSSVGDGVIVSDLNGNIIAANNAFEEQSGYQASEVIGQQIYPLLIGVENPEKSAEIQAALSSRYGWSGELTTVRKNGRRYDIQLTIAPVRNQSGEIIGYVGSQRDITEYKELERLKDQFILEVSHELRTPVTNMGLFVELMERGKPEKREEYLTILKSEIHQLTHMIEDILDLSRLEIGKHKRITFTMVDLNLLAEQVVSAHCPLAEENGLSLLFEPDRSLPRVRGEPNQLSRVITNLLSNAIRYTPAGFVQVRTFRSDGWICLEVKDTGIGIDPEDYPHLFERFYRGQKVSQSKIMGSGLGLAIVKEIVDIHEGKIEWQSENGKGSTFQIYLPG